MKLIKTANGNKIKLSRSEWEQIGKTAGWHRYEHDTEDRDMLIATFIDLLNSQKGDPGQEEMDTIPIDVLKQALSVLEDNLESQKRAFEVEMGWEKEDENPVS
ncbi:MAG: hypothetical protein JSW62_00595 [Thermoplasmatales archaeon]|nr:MAG: hypothetical protein JSW62_00595 [Thermoplasmatales archaeon]